jgi:glutathione reductase (NADPH)
VKKFDVVVVGTGEAGSSAAFGCREAGLSVAIADCRPFGGTCALRGCDPKKVLVAAEELADWSRRFERLDVVRGDLRIDWAGLMRFKRTFTTPVPASREAAFVDAGIEPYHGRVSFLDVSNLRIDDDTVAADHVVIATGAEPKRLGIPGEDLLTTSEQFLELDHLPRSIVMVGGGYISFEFAHVAARAGASVTIVHQGERPLEQFDPDLVDALVQATVDLGIDVRLNASVRSIERDGESLAVEVVARDGSLTVLHAAMAVHGAGRVPDVEGLAAEAAGVAVTANGVAVDEYLQSVSQPTVFAAGDAADTGEPRLTPVASAEGEIVATNLVQGRSRTVTLGPVPSIVFTTPALGTVGLTEQKARDRKMHFRVTKGDTTDWYSSRRVAATKSAFKVLIDDDSERILGASILGPGAEELTNLFAMAIRFEIPGPSLRETLFAYPTAASDLASMV